MNQTLMRAGSVRGALAVLLGLALLAPPGAGAQTLTASGDAHVRGGSAANNNYGGVVLLGVKTANQALQTYWSYIKFDTSTVSGQVVSARLRLLTALSSTGSVQTNLYATSSAWGESTITWNNKPALGAQLGSFTVANTAYVWFEVDVTSYVQSQQGQGALAFALVNPAVSSQLVAVQSRESSNPPQLVLTMNEAPTVSLTSPANGATFTAPASVTLTAAAADADGSIQKVEFFHGGTNLIATVTSAPYTFNWTNVAAGSYSLTAKATDNLGGETTSAPVNITVNAAVAQLFFIHTDHLDTPRVITNGAGQAVWRWEQSDPFGGNPPDENPSGLGTFTCNLRLPGQYFDKESNTHYNYYRDYDPAIGRYIQSDPIGLRGGINTYLYVGADPLLGVDPLGLAKFCCRFLESVFVGVPRERETGIGYRHCYVVADDGTTYSLYPETVKGKQTGVPRPNDPRDTGGDCFDCPKLECMDQDSCLRNANQSYPRGNYGSIRGPNSNTYAGTLARSCCKGGVPGGVRGAPGIDGTPPSPR